MKYSLFGIFFLFAFNSFGQVEDPFAQLGTLLPTPNAYRNAAGAPGVDYWQQQADYKIQVELDDEKQTITGSETVTYHNNSPADLEYLWLQLDQNRRAKDSDTEIVSGSSMQEKMSDRSLKSFENDFDGGFKLTKVTDTDGKALPYIINKTIFFKEPYYIY